VTYRAELSGRALKQMHGLPGLAFDRLIETMAKSSTIPTIRFGPSRPAIRTSGA
jgi:hypothetical protein